MAARDTVSSDVRALAVSEARTWIGTPYHYRAAVKGVGCDCVGLINAVWSAITGQPMVKMPAYSMDFADTRRNERMLAAAARYLAPVDIDKGAAGDVALFRWRDTQSVKHAGILTERGRMIHADEMGGVCEVDIHAWRRGKKLAAIFSFGEP